MQNYKLTLCYDGTRYRGWQKQGNTAQTVQGKLETLLSRALEQPIEIAGSGRTDAGVHARMQMCSFRADTDKSCAELLALLREYLPEDIGALALEKAPERFHARLSAVRKTYIYRVWNSDAPCVFERKYVHAEPRPLDLDAMRRAAAQLCGQHEFSAFSTGKKTRRHAHDRVYRDRTLRGRSAAYVYRRRVLIQYGAHPDRHAARGRSRRAPSGRYGGDPCLAQPCECRFYRPGAGAFPLECDVLSE